MDDDQDRYVTALHAMQSGVALDEQRGAQDLTPKHLRVGVNSAMCEHAGLVALLVRKGLVTYPEYMTAIADEMEAEVKRYEVRLSETLGSTVKLR